MKSLERMYEQGRIQSLDELKKIYRILAKHIHPDIIGSGVAEEHFVHLKDEFDACAALIARKTDSIQAARTYSRREIIELLIEIEATGFFLHDARTRRTKLYQERLVRFNRMLGSLNIDQVRDIFAIEQALCRLRVEDRDIYDSVKLIMYNIVAYHYEPRRFILETTRRLHAGIQHFKHKDTYLELYAFLGWLVDDLTFGSVFE